MPYTAKLCPMYYSYLPDKSQISRINEVGRYTQVNSMQEINREHMHTASHSQKSPEKQS